MADERSIRARENDPCLTGHSSLTMADRAFVGYSRACFGAFRGFTVPRALPAGRPVHKEDKR